jgi:hypothetical protein
MILSQIQSWRSFGRQVLDVLVDDHELGHRGDVEARALLVEGADDLRVGLALTAK